MDSQLNYHHLLYFWTVLKEGGVSAAGARLRVAQPTVSGQLRALEQSLGGKLLERRGRRLLPTELGTLVFRYADEIFSIGSELSDALRGRPTARPQRLSVGVADSMPKLVAWRILEPALRGPPGSAGRATAPFPLPRCSRASCAGAPESSPPGASRRCRSASTRSPWSAACGIRRWWPSPNRRGRNCSAAAGRADSRLVRLGAGKKRARRLHRFVRPRQGEHVAGQE